MKHKAGYFGLLSWAIRSAFEVKDGSVIAIPNDPVNQERAVRILEELGWVKVKPGAGTTDFNLSSVEPDKYQLKLEALDSAQIPVSLADVDYGVVNGNYIANAKRAVQTFTDNGLAAFPGGSHKLWGTHNGLSYFGTFHLSVD